MARLSVVAACAAVVLVALPLRAQRAEQASDSASARTVIPILVTAEAPERDMRTLMRANRFLAAELRRTAEKEARLQTRLDSLKRIVTERERAIESINSEAAAVRAARHDLEARIARLESAGPNDR